MSDNTRIAKNTLFLYFRSFLMMAVNLYASRIILQALGVSDYGLYGAVGSIVAMFTIINGVLAAGSSRFLTFELGRGNYEELKKTFSASFALHVVMALLLLIMFETIGLWFVNYKMKIPEGREFAANIVYQLSVLTCMFSLTQVPYRASIIAHEHMAIYAYVGLAEALFKLVLVFLLLYIPFVDNLVAYAIIVAFWSIVLQIFYRFYCYKHFPESHLVICRDKSIYKGMLSYSLWDMVGQFCSTGNTQGLNILINLFFGVTINATRAVAYQVESVLTQFSSNFMTAVNPQIVKSYANNDVNRFFYLIYESGKYSFFLLFIVSLPILLETDYILSIWLVKVPEQTVLFLRLIIIHTLLRVFVKPVINGVHATGNVKTLNLTSGLYSALTFLPAIYCLYKLGLPAWSCFYVQYFSGAVCTLLEVRALYKNIRFNVVDFFVKVYACAISIALIASIPSSIILLFLDEGLFRLIAVCITSIVSSVFCVLFLGMSKHQRINILYHVTKKMIR